MLKNNTVHRLHPVASRQNLFPRFALRQLFCENNSKTGWFYFLFLDFSGTAVSVLGQCPTEFQLKTFGKNIVFLENIQTLLHNHIHFTKRKTEKRSQKISGDSRQHKYFWLYLVKIYIKMSTLISKKSIVSFPLAIYSHFSIRRNCNLSLHKLCFKKRKGKEREGEERENSQV